MNVIFTIIFIISGISLAIKDPNLLLSALQSGANKALLLSASLAAVYSVWSGALEIAERSGVNVRLAKLLKPIINFLFGNVDEETRSLIAVNTSANLLGMGGIATPPAVKATKRLTDEKNHDGATMLFVIAATSIQLLPTTVISLRQAAGSSSPASILLPTFLSTVVSTAIGVTLCKLTARKKRI